MDSDWELMQEEKPGEIRTAEVNQSHVICR